MEKILTFKVGNEKFCFDVFSIIGIDQKTKVSSVPLSAKHHIGMMNLRGQIIPVIDLRVLFNVDTVGNDREQCYVFVEQNEKKMACLVDAVYEVVDCASTNHAQSTSDQNLAAKNSFVVQVINLNNEIIFSLNPELIYNSVDLQFDFQGNNVNLKTAV